MRAIKLTQGYEALVDDEDYERVSLLKWNADVQHINRYGIRYVRAKRSVKIGIKIRTIWMQHYILNIIPWELSGKVIDHIDRNPLNNSRSNLRIVSKGENNFNRIKYGVSFHKKNNKWIAYSINGRGTQKHIGCFSTREEAIKAAKCAQ